MEVYKRKGEMTLALMPECAINDVESDADKLRSKINDVELITVKSDQVTEMDTAYFQLILSLMSTADEAGIQFSMPQMSDTVRDMFELFGLSIGD